MLGPLLHGEGITKTIWARFLFRLSVPMADEVFLLREVGSGTRAAVEELFEVAGIPLNIGMVLGHIEAIKQAVAAGLGVSVLSEVAVKREVHYHRLAILQAEHSQSSVAGISHTWPTDL